MTVSYLVDDSARSIVLNRIVNPHEIRGGLIDEPQRLGEFPAASLIDAATNRSPLVETPVHPPRQNLGLMMCKFVSDQHVTTLPSHQIKRCLNFGDWVDHLWIPNRVEDLIEYISMIYVVKNRIWP
jgi:hypothetical protein